jgi:hypothetical protein
LARSVGITAACQALSVSRSRFYRAQKPPRSTGAELHSTRPSPRALSADEKAWAQAFFTWYNQAHHHTGLGLLTPFAVHYRQVEQVLQQRQEASSFFSFGTPEMYAS